MLIAIIGESCVGKSTLAERLKTKTAAEIISGKDYLRMAKSEGEAIKLFKEKLCAAVDGENVIYVISEREHIALLPEGAIKVVVTCDLALIKERFKARMRGVLPPPVEQMLERKHGIFDSEPCAIRVDTTDADVDALCDKILAL